MDVACGVIAVAGEDGRQTRDAIRCSEVKCGGAGNGAGATSVRVAATSGGRIELDDVAGMLAAPTPAHSAAGA